MDQDQTRDGHLAAAIRKATWRLIPFLCLAYTVNFLDRVNVGFAALHMNEDLAFRRASTASAPASSSSAISPSRSRAISLCIASARASGSRVS
ncbi:hypothetical protein AUC71_00885 [Methyloceanibacter marginalis]|uniref:Major facilitator superfamily (MFS) profile domain-containing protein n=1 Tax=Methyloceanibacter marginalis TaxID=1774971 RepID=A0A1E3WC52_9HYPH|nr:hypothetical protein [Methyloceanibacter marginalis]ODS03403.1 hypothetical protein AUC71_00885 [Methyloceanibacter marginalis]